MRIASAVALASALGACAAAPDEGGDDPIDPPIEEPPPRGFQLKSPEQVIPAGRDATYCWYFQTPNDETFAIKRWRSTMTTGARYMVVYTTASDKRTLGEMSQIGCGIANVGAGDFPQWIYATHEPANDLVFPSNDGAGKPLAMDIGPHQSGFIQMHYENRTDRDMVAQVTLDAEALQPGAAYTKTASYSTYNSKISIPQKAVDHTQAETCNVSPASKFWSMTTRTHMQGDRTAVRNGMPTSTSMAFQSTDWTRPGVARWDGTFFTFDTGKLTYECTWDNPTNRVITTGDNAVLNEICMASGYYFPATQPVLCYNSDSGL